MNNINNKIFWFTGQPNSGKTTLSKELIKSCFDSNDYFFIDGDQLRDLTRNFDYSEKGRRKNIEDAQLICSYLYNSGKNVIVAMVSPYRDMREDFKNKYPVNEIYLISNRSGKENYKISYYEPPINNYLLLETDKKTIQECVNEISKHFSINKKIEYFV